MTVWDVLDVLENQAKRDHDEIRWLMAASPYENPMAILGRRRAIDEAEQKASARDEWLDRAAADRDQRRAGE